LTPEQRRAAIEAIEAQEALIERRERNKLFTYYPDTGPLSGESFTPSTWRSLLPAIRIASAA
jgi:hypothetical protein